MAYNCSCQAERQGPWTSCFFYSGLNGVTAIVIAVVAVVGVVLVTLIIGWVLLKLRR